MVRKKTSFLIAIGLFLFFFLYYSHNLKILPIQYYDECWWIGRSFFFELFLKQDFKNPLWNDYFGFDQPKLTSYFFGLVLYPSYLKQKDIHNQYDFNKYLIDNSFFEKKNHFYSDYKNKSSSFVDWERKDMFSGKELLKKYGTNFLNTINIVYRIRKFNSILMILNILLIFFITSIFSDAITAGMTSFLYGLNSIVVQTGLIAHAESLFLFNFYLGILSLLMLVKKNILPAFKNKNYYWSAVFIISTVFCISTKLHGFILLILFNVLGIVTVFWFLLSRKFLKITHAMFFYLFVNLLILSLFILLDPYLYPQPLKNFLYMLYHRNDVSNWQMEVFGPALYSYQDRFSAIYNNFFGQNSALFNLLSFLRINYKFLGAIYFILFLTGIVSIYKQKKNDLLRIQKYFLLFFITILIIVILYLKLDWERYYLPILFFILYYEVNGFMVVLKTLKKFLCRFRILLVDFRKIF